jgi:hypothetical protein
MSTADLLSAGCKKMVTVSLSVEVIASSAPNGSSIERILGSCTKSAADRRALLHIADSWLGLSGAKLIWGSEACAVRSDGRANPKQLYMADHTQGGIAELREILIKAYKRATGDDRHC